MLKKGFVAGLLTVTGLHIKCPGGSIWNCICSCGNTAKVYGTNLKSGKTTSCGCARRRNTSRIGKANRTHGESSGGQTTPEYRAWVNMQKRCYDPTDKSYANYGGRGIKVCAQWRRSFSKFLAYVGRRPSPTHSIDRIRVNAGYAPGNVRWATSLEQGGNKRNSIVLRHAGERRTLAQWADKLGVPRSTLYARHRKGLPVGEVLACRK